MSNNREIQHLRKLSILMDSKFTGPFGFKFGLDGLIGLIPFVGDFISTAISVYIILQGAKVGCAPSTIFRMGLNILIENLADMFPLFGNVFDFLWKSNNKNIELIENHLQNPRTATIKSRLALGLVAFSLLGFLIASVSISFLIFRSIFDWIVLLGS